jgi:hypothetical protein
MPAELIIHTSLIFITIALLGVAYECIVSN